MLTLLRSVIISLLLAFHGGFNLHAQQDSPVSVLEISGARTQIELLHEFLTEGLDTLAPTALRDPIKSLKGVLDETFQPDTLAAAVGDTFLSDLDETALSKLTAFGASRTGSKIARACSLSRTAKGRAACREFEEWMKPRRPTYRRTLLLDRLDQNLGATVFARNTLLPLIDTVLEAAHAGLPSEKQLPREQLDRVLSSTRTKASRAIGQSIRLRWLYLYRGLTNDELQAYNQFLETKEGRRVAGLQEKAVGECYASAVERLRARL